MPEEIARLRIELQHIDPPIWRRVDVSVTTNLRALHDLVQTVMPWKSYRLYQFNVGEKVYGEPAPDDAIWGRKIFQSKDLRNANVNYTVTVGTIDGNEFIIRTAPTFAEIVEETVTQAQFVMAGNLDGLANVPYLAADAGYGAMVNQIVALNDPAAQQLALEQLSYSFLSAYSGIGTGLGRDAVMAMGDAPARGADGVLSTKGTGPQWALNENLEAFVSLGGSQTSVDATANNAGYDLNTRSIWAGLETRLSDNLSFGLMVGGVSSDADISGNRGTLDASGAGAALFARTSFGGSGRLQGIIGLQNLGIDSTRVIAPAGAVADGTTDGTLTFAAVEADWMMKRGTFGFGPMASFEYYRMDVDGFTETGAGIWNMSVGDQATTTTQASLGVKGEMALSASTLAFGHLAWTKQSGDAALISTSFAGMPSMLTPVDAGDADWVDLGLGISTTLQRANGGTTRIGAEYRGALAGNGQDGHALRLFVDMTF